VKINMQQNYDDEKVCLICAEDIKIYALGECNHKYICHVCTIKMREKCRDNKCPLCKVKYISIQINLLNFQNTLDHVIITDKLDADYKDFNLKTIIV
jgi:hypothetical protein